MGPEFKPFLPVVMPSLLLTVSVKADLSAYGMCSESYIGYLLMTSGVLYRRRERQGFRGSWRLGDDCHGMTNSTSAMDEKCQAFETLVIYCSTLGPRFAPYLVQTLEVTFPCLRFYFHEGVREACAMWVLVLVNHSDLMSGYRRLIPMLLSCGKESGTLTNQKVSATFLQW